MRVLVAQINPTIGDLAKNKRLIVGALAHGRQQNVDVVLFPELALTGYPPRDLLLLPHFLDEIEAVLESLLSETKGLAAVIGLPRRNPDAREKPLFNSAAIIQDGKLLGYQDKYLLPTYDVFDERRYFAPNRQAPHLWNLAGKSVAITICEDIWQHSAHMDSAHYLRDPVEELAELHPAVMLNLSASPFSTTKFQARLQAVATAARSLQCPVFLCNQVGGNDSLIFDGASVAVDERGRLCAVAQSFAEDRMFVDTGNMQAEDDSQRDASADLYQALALGIRDYFHKQGFSKACLGLSGGIDSALVACLAVEALGKENVLGILMPSRYSSPESLSDAEALAQALEIKTHLISIEQPFDTYLQLLEPQFAGKPADTTEENLQARIRGMILMALSNKEGYIVLSTGNKSEMAMGYGTLYGDLVGGLAVLSDITKQQVYALAHFINRDKKIIPQNSIDKPPSAELRPDQKDTDSLPDYSIVDTVLQDYVEGHLSPEKIAAKHNFSLELVQDLIRRIHQNEYKRRQAPLGLRVSEKAFSVGRQFPVVQGFVS